MCTTFSTYVCQTAIGHQQPRLNLLLHQSYSHTHARSHPPVAAEISLCIGEIYGVSGFLHISLLSPLLPSQVLKDESVGEEEWKMWMYGKHYLGMVMGD